jgi:pimeloyl-ACP methyl ester carboxylesterase
MAKTIHSPAGADIFVRWGGTGPVVLLLHGYAENSDSWAPLAEDLMKDHTVVVPDLRGIGRSSKPVSGYDKKTQAQDMRAIVTELGYDRTFVVAHDIGNMVAYAYTATYPDKVERLVVMDAPLPGIDPWAEILQNPGVWHFNFHGLDAERLVTGRERIYFDRIWNDFTGDPGLALISASLARSARTCAHLSELFPLTQQNRRSQLAPRTVIIHCPLAVQ